MLQGLFFFATYTMPIVEEHGRRFGRWKRAIAAGPVFELLQLQQAYDCDIGHEKV